MKKWFIALCMTICLLSLTACGKEDTATYLGDAEAASLAASAVQLVSGVVSEGMEEVYIAQAVSNGEDGQVYRSAFESWSKSVPDLGTYLGEGELKMNTMELDAVGNLKSGTIQLGLLGSNHDATLELVVERGEIKAITTNVEYSFGESMAKAGLNTLLGMGTVFVVLILISLIISAFNLIPKIQGMFSKKSETPAAKVVDNTIAQIIEKEEELSDDFELVAVISAAIAAYEGTSSDGFVVRSIRKSR